MYNWHSIKQIRRFGYVLVLANIIIAYILISNKNKNPTKKEFLSGPVSHIIAKRGVKLRNEPNITANVITNIANGEAVTIVNDTSTINKGWIEVNYRGRDGWVWGSFVK